jgi:hypothetical protein
MEHIGKATTYRLTLPREVLPTRPSSFRLLAMAFPYWMLVGSHCYDSTIAELLEERQ